MLVASGPPAGGHAGGGQSALRGATVTDGSAGPASCRSAIRMARAATGRSSRPPATSPPRLTSTPVPVTAQATVHRRPGRRGQTGLGGRPEVHLGPRAGGRSCARRDRRGWPATRGPGPGGRAAAVRSAPRPRGPGRTPGPPGLDRRSDRATPPVNRAATRASSIAASSVSESTVIARPTCMQPDQLAVVPEPTGRGVDPVGAGGPPRPLRPGGPDQRPRPPPWSRARND